MAEHRVLGREVVLDRPDGHAGARRDGADARRLEPALRDHFEQHRAQPVAAHVVVDRGGCHTVVWYCRSITSPAPAESRSARFARRHPRLHALRHVAKGTGKAAAALIGLALLINLLPAIPWPDIPLP